MKEIKIEGLTPNQIDLLDIMWNIESPDDLYEWMNTLEDDDFKEVVTLKELLLSHCFDEIDETKIAKDYLKKFRL